LNVHKREGKEKKGMERRGEESIHHKLVSRLINETLSSGQRYIASEEIRIS
jgi:hypothetical protein